MNIKKGNKVLPSNTGNTGNISNTGNMGKLSKALLKKLYEDQDLSIRDIAGRLGLHPDTVHYWLKKYGIETRSKGKRSQLRKHSLSSLERGVKKYGVRGFAAELGIHENTLRHHLRIRRKRGKTNCVG